MSYHSVYEFLAIKTQALVLHHFKVINWHVMFPIEAHVTTEHKRFNVVQKKLCFVGLASLVLDHKTQVS